MAISSGLRKATMTVTSPIARSSFTATSMLRGSLRTTFASCAYTIFTDKSASLQIGIRGLGAVTDTYLYWYDENCTDSSPPTSSIDDNDISIDGNTYNSVATNSSSELSNIAIFWYNLSSSTEQMEIIAYSSDPTATVYIMTGIVDNVYNTSILIPVNISNSDAVFSSSVESSSTIYTKLLLKDETAQTSLDIKNNPTDTYLSLFNTTYSLDSLEGDTEYDLYSVADNGILLQPTPSKISFKTLLKCSVPTSDLLSQPKGSYFTISCSTPNSEIYYSVNSSKIYMHYNAPILIKEDITILRAFATATGAINSNTLYIMSNKEESPISSSSLIHTSHLFTPKAD